MLSAGLTGTVVSKKESVPVAQEENCFFRSCCLNLQGELNDHFASDDGKGDVPPSFAPTPNN